MATSILSRFANKSKTAKPVVPKPKAIVSKTTVEFSSKPAVKTKTGKRKPLGEALVSTATKSCINCALYSKCVDERKSGHFLCTRFSARVLTLADVKGGKSIADDAKAAITAFDKRLLSGPTYLSPKAAAKAERSLEKMLNKALETSGVMAADPRIDDRDIPTAPNFFSWITEERFAGNLINPWAKQIEYPTRLYSEWCPNCTNMKWWNNVPVDALPDDFLNNVQFLDFGVCPRCHTPKSEFAADGLLNPYNELAGRAGQRCVGLQTTMPIAGVGLVRFDELLKQNGHSTTEPDSFKRLRGKVFAFNRHNKHVRVSHTYVNGKKNSLFVDTSIGELVTSEVHPLWVVGRGWVETRHLKPGDKLQVRINQQAFGTKTVGIDRALALGWFTSEGCIVYNEKGKAESALISQASITNLERLVNLFAAAGFGSASIGMPADDKHVPCMRLLAPAARELHTILHMASPLMTAGKARTDRVRSYTVNIPLCIRQAPKAEVVQFLRGLYAGDGFIIQATGDVGYSTVSRQLAADLCSMLTNFGIVPLLNKKVIVGAAHSDTAVGYSVIITGEMVQKFYEQVGFDCERKQADLERSVMRNSGRSASHPMFTHYGNALAGELRQIQLPPRSVCGVRTGRVVSKEMVQRIREHALNEVSETVDFVCEDDVYVAEVRAVTPAGKRMLADVTVPDGHEFVAHGLVNHNSSKTFTVMLQVTYDTHRMLKSQNPQAMFGLPSSQMLAATLAATTFAQAKGNMWDVLQPMFNEANWFVQYHAMLDQTGAKIGAELYAVKDTFARYRHRNITLVPSGPNPTTQRGLTRWMVVIDEIGYLKTGKTKTGGDYALTNAEGVHDALGRSLLTVRTAAYKALMSGNENVPMGYMFCVSSPSSQTDMIMKLHARSKNSKLLFGYFGATWDINPTIKKNDPIIAEAYRVNYSNAHRDYGAVPPISGSPFLRMPSLKEVFATKRYNDGEVVSRLITNRSGGEQTSGRVKFYRDHNGGPCVVSVDSGYNNNSFSIAVTESMGNGKARLRFLGELILTKDAPIHYPSVMRNVVQPVIQHYGASLLISDRWQSYQLLQQMEEEEGITPITHTLKYPDFARFRQEGIYDGKLKMPTLDASPKEAMRISRKPGYPGPFAGFPMAHLIYQLVAVQDLPGQTVNKPEGGTDDNFRAVVLGWHAATDSNFAEFLHMPDNSRPTRALGSIAKGRGLSVSSGLVVSSMGVKRSVGMGGGSSSGSNIGTLRRGI